MTLRLGKPFVLSPRFNSNHSSQRTPNVCASFFINRHWTQYIDNWKQDRWFSSRYASLNTYSAPWNRRASAMFVRKYSGWLHPFHSSIRSVGARLPAGYRVVPLSTARSRLYHKNKLKTYSPLKIRTTLIKGRLKSADDTRLCCETAHESSRPVSMKKWYITTLQGAL